MRDILRALFVSAVVILVGYQVRLVHRVWFSGGESALAKYEEPTAAEDLTKVPLDDLLRRFGEARGTVRAYESDSANQAVEDENRSETEPYATELRLRYAVEAVEELAQSWRDLRYYCLLGIAMVLGGMLCFVRVNDLVGLSLLISGFGQMIKKSAPGFCEAQLNRGFQIGQLAFSALALVLLLVAGRATGALSRETGEGADEDQGQEGEP